MYSSAYSPEVLLQTINAKNAFVLFLGFIHAQIREMNVAKKKIEEKIVLGIHSISGDYFGIPEKKLFW